MEPSSLLLGRRARCLLQVLREEGAVLLCAESCTGGWLGKLFTDIPGSSDVFEGSLVTYSNRLKSTLLGVDKKKIKQFGAVSEEVVQEMTDGLIRLRGNAPLYTLAVSGIAGPGGGSQDKPVGTVWIAVSAHGEFLMECSHFSGNRRSIRKKAMRKGLEMLDWLRKGYEQLDRSDFTD